MAARTASTDPALTADDKAKQTRLLITYTENSFTNANDDATGIRRITARRSRLKRGRTS